MKSRYNIQHLLSPGFSKNIEDSSQVAPPPALPVNVFEINVEEYLANNVMETPMPFKPIDENMQNAKIMRQALGIKVGNTTSTTNNTNYTSSSSSSNYRTNPLYQSSYDSHRKPLSTNGTSTTKFGFSKH